MKRLTEMKDLPSKFDWRDQKVVGPVISQESCGACWAFSTIGVVESMYAIKNGTLYSFSVQEVGRYIPDTFFYLSSEGTARKSSRSKTQILLGSVFTEYRRIN